jgi:hypothetical protein
MPTSATDTFTIAGLVPAFQPDKTLPLSVKLVASTTYPAGCLLGEVTASPGTFGPYASGASDGTQNPKAILKYALTTDANGAFSLGQYSGARQDAEAYFKGVFRTDDLPQSSTGAINATALTNQPGWKLLEGTIATGLIDLG